MAAIKTQKNNASIDAFLQTVKEEAKRKDCEIIFKMMKQITKEEPKMWGSSIVGFGTYHYKSERSKQEGDWFMTGFSPRKQNITIYIMPGFADFSMLLNKLGKHKTSVGCLYINKLADIHFAILKELVGEAYKKMKLKQVIK